MDSVNVFISDCLWLVIVDGIFTSACFYLSSSCAHEEVSVLVELHIFPKHRIPRLMASRNCEVMLHKTYAAHCLDDKSRVFLVIGIGATNINNCPIFS